MTIATVIRVLSSNGGSFSYFPNRLEKFTFTLARSHYPLNYPLTASPEDAEGESIASLLLKMQSFYFM